MNQRTERALILVTGLIAFMAHQASASVGAGSTVPTDFHPELTPLERQFVWNEVQNNTGAALAARAPIYVSTVLSDGSHLSPLALAALAAEAARTGAMQ